MFRVRAPEALTPTPPRSGQAEVTRPDAPTPPPALREPAAPAAVTGDAPAPPASDAPPPTDRERLVLIADSDVDGGKQTAAAVASWGLKPILVHDGVEAMLTIQRMLPRAVVLDAALPKMFGFQICEIVKRNESLRDTHVVLIGAIHDRDRYRRPPGELYGADVYVERPDLPDGLETVLRRFGVPLGAPGEAATPAPTPAPIPVEAAPPPPAPAPVEAAAPTAPPPRAEAPVASPAQPAAPPAGGDGLDDERAKAERLARIIVSDIVLYNPEKFDEAVKAGDVVGMLDPALEEGRELFRQRIDERVRDERDYLEAELKRVATERAGR